MPKIFISYRREDSQSVSDRLHEKLEDRFGTKNVFFDIDSIPFGRDFVEYLDEQVSQCDVLLAVIGKRWLATKTEGGASRLHDENDFVRIEIASALTRGITVIPVLVEGAEMPLRDKLPPTLETLVRRQAAELRPGSDFRRDVDRLIKALEPNNRPSAQNPEPPDEFSVQQLRKEAQRGIPEAQNYLGWMYANGEGVEKDEEEAVKWYRKAADQDLPQAQSNLGVMYANGEGVEKDEKEAFKWYRKAAEQNDANAQHNLGVMYDPGRGVEKDDKKRLSGTERQRSRVMSLLKLL